MLKTLALIASSLVLNLSMGVLDNNQAAFVEGVSKGTGIDPRVVIAWIQQEGAFKSGGTGGFNYLNITPFAGDKRAGVSAGGFSQFNNVQDSIVATNALLHQPQYGPIIATARSKPTPKQQINAIAASPWDANHYGGSGGPVLVSVFSRLFGGNTGLNDHYVGPDQARNIATDFQGNAADWTSIDMTSVGNAAGQVAHDIAAPFESIGQVLSWIGNNWDRILWVIGGSILLILGFNMVYKSQVSA